MGQQLPADELMANQIHDLWLQAGSIAVDDEIVQLEVTCGPAQLYLLLL